jgi:hypothetical protein
VFLSSGFLASFHKQCDFVVVKEIGCTSVAACSGITEPTNLEKLLYKVVCKWGNGLSQCHRELGRTLRDAVIRAERLLHRKCVNGECKGYRLSYIEGFSELHQGYENQSAIVV